MLIDIADVATPRHRRTAFGCEIGVIAIDIGEHLLHERRIKVDSDCC
ncbi:hypothetical protein [Bradyrhizobium elkanii]